MEPNGERDREQRTILLRSVASGSAWDTVVRSVSTQIKWQFYNNEITTKEVKLDARSENIVTMTDTFLSGHERVKQGNRSTTM
jgi:hypothetical protein